MGGFTYTTKQGDMWDYIAWRVYGDESLVYLLYRENPKYLDTFIFDEGVKLYCPEVEVINEDEDEDSPEWQDDSVLPAATGKRFERRLSSVRSFRRTG